MDKKLTKLFDKEEKESDQTYIYKNPKTSNFIKLITI